MAIRGVLLDIAGVLYEGEQVVPGAIDAVRRLRAAELPLRLVTNTSRQPKRLLLERLGEFGFDISPSEVFTAPAAAAARLRRDRLRPLLLIHPGLDEEFAAFPVDRPNAVVVGDAAERMTYPRLNAAFRLLMEGAPLLAIATNRHFRDVDGLSLDAGPFVVALAYAARVEPEVFGKPAPAFFREALADLGTQPEETLMIGDDVEADVNGALALGLRAMLVRTGKYQPGDAERISGAGRCVDDVGAAVAAALDASA